MKTENIVRENLPLLIQQLFSCNMEKIAISSVSAFGLSKINFKMHLQKIFH